MQPSRQSWHANNAQTRYAVNSGGLGPKKKSASQRNFGDPGRQELRMNRGRLGKKE